MPPSLAGSLFRGLLSPVALEYKKENADCASLNNAPLVGAVLMSGRWWTAAALRLKLL